MNRWKIFFKERIPLPVYALIALGISLSSALLNADKLDTASVIVGFIVVMLYLVTLA